MYTNYMIDQFMSQKKNNTIDLYFENKDLEEINKKIKNDNKYALDYFGIPIRRKEMDKRKQNGWIKDGDRIYHYLVNKELIGIIDDEIIRDKTIETIKQKYPKVFTQNTATHKIIQMLYGDKYE